MGEMKFHVLPAAPHVCGAPHYRWGRRTTAWVSRITTDNGPAVARVAVFPFKKYCK